MTSSEFSTFETPIGAITVWAAEGKVYSLQIGEGAARNGAAAQAVRHSAATDRPGVSHLDTQEVLKLSEKQLKEYFAGKRREFQIPLRTHGTEFQQRVWTKLMEIPFGTSSSYRQLAEATNRPRAARAIGGAVGANPVPIVIGCHRVLAADGALTGYSGGSGLDTKRWLLLHEEIPWRN